MKRVQKSLIVLAIYIFTFLWIIVNSTVNSLALEYCDNKYLLLLSIFTAFFILIIGFLIINLGKIEKKGFILEFFIIDLPGLLLLSLNILYFSGINFFVNYQDCFGICTITGGLLLSCDISRIVAYKQKSK